MGDRVQFFFSACACLPFRYFSPFRATKQTRNMDGPPLFSFFASKIRAASVLGCWRDVVAWLPRTDGRMVPTAPLFYSPRSDFFFFGLGLVRACLGWCERSGACGGGAAVSRGFKSQQNDRGIVFIIVCTGSISEQRLPRGAVRPIPFG
jgi:hypothetical protein